MRKFSVDRFMRYCDRQTCTKCPLYEEGLNCARLGKLLDACCGETMTMRDTIELLTKALQVIDAVGNGQKEADSYGHYCIDRAISALLDMTE